MITYVISSVSHTVVVSSLNRNHYTSLAIIVVSQWFLFEINKHHSNTEINVIKRQTHWIVWRTGGDVPSDMRDTRSLCVAVGVRTALQVFRLLLTDSDWKEKCLKNVWKMKKFLHLLTECLLHVWVRPLISLAELVVSHYFSQFTLNKTQGQTNSTLQFSFCGKFFRSWHSFYDQVGGSV